MKKMIVSVLALLVLTTSVFANSTYQTLPFSQNWSDVSLITTANDWSAVPGIIGHRGDNGAQATNYSPVSCLLSLETSVQVYANFPQVSTAFTSGGVAEFELTDPVVAFQGSGTADSPFLLIHLNTTGISSVKVDYTLRDIDDTADNAAQWVALQYRVGETGDFTNIPEAYIADASAGPSLTMSTTVSVYLPAACCNQAQVQLRIMTTNVTGSDEWVGVDDISVTAVTSAVREWEIYTK